MINFILYQYFKKEINFGCKHSFRAYSIPPTLGWPYRFYLLCNPWSFDQTFEIRFGPSKFDCALAVDECGCDGYLDLLS